MKEQVPDSTRSRRDTPRDGAESLTASQEFIRNVHLSWYDGRHIPLAESEESEFINCHIPESCPKCSSGLFKRNGFNANGT